MNLVAEVAYAAAGAAAAGVFLAAFARAVFFTADLLPAAFFTAAFCGRPRFAFTGSSGAASDCPLILAHRAFCASAMRLRTAALLFPRVFVRAGAATVADVPSSIA